MKHCFGFVFVLEDVDQSTSSFFGASQVNACLAFQMPAVVGSLPPPRGPHMPGPYDAAKNKKPLTSNEISGFWQG